MSPVTRWGLQEAESEVELNLQAAFKGTLLASMALEGRGEVRGRWLEGEVL